jgi:deoxyribonuclease-2
VFRPSSESVGWIFYNDKFPLDLQQTNVGSKGHTKGVLVFDIESDSALWLLHSVPRFPLSTSDGFPSDELDYGQTFLCVTLRNVATAETIVRQMLTQQGPQTYGTHFPAALPTSSPWRDLADGMFSLSTTPSDIAFSSRAGRAFRSLAKSRLWGQDLWTDWVEVSLGIDLDMESWHRGALSGDHASDNHDVVTDVISIDLQPLGAPYAWQNVKDHANWAVSLHDNDDWVCVADINRQVSQGQRGSGTICFRERSLWADLSQINRFNLSL